MTINAFTAADQVLVVVSPGYFELDSIVQISKRHRPADAAHGAAIGISTAGCYLHESIVVLTAYAPARPSRTVSGPPALARPRASADRGTVDAGTAQVSLARQILARSKGSFAEELGVNLCENSPTALFQLLCFSLLSATRISARIAMAAARALADAGWTTATSMSRSSWEDRVRVLDSVDYVRYDFRAATRLGQLCDLLNDRYGGDLRRLREAADRDSAGERRLLQEFTGIGPIGADIFLREAQAVWPEVRPYVDARAAAGARRLGLPTAPDELAALVDPHDFHRLVAALVRCGLSHHTTHPIRLDTGCTAEPNRAPAAMNA